MKIFKSYIKIAFFALFVLVSCDIEPIDSAIDTSNLNDGGNNSGGNNSGGGNGNNTYYFKVKIDGVQKQWNQNIALIPNINNEEALSIVGIDTNDNSAITLSIFTENVLNTGVYNLEFIEVGCTYSLNDSDYSSDYSDGSVSPGNITILERNTTNQTIKGTFNFIGKNNEMTQSKTLTEGEFFLHYN